MYLIRQIQLDECDVVDSVVKLWICCDGFYLMTKTQVKLRQYNYDFDMASIIRWPQYNYCFGLIVSLVNVLKCYIYHGFNVIASMQRIRCNRYNSMAKIQIHMQRQCCCSFLWCYSLDKKIMLMLIQTQIIQLNLFHFQNHKKASKNISSKNRQIYYHEHNCKNTWKYFIRFLKVDQKQFCG